MVDQRIDIRSKEGFSIFIKFLAIVFIAMSFLVIGDYPAMAAIFSFICLLILTGRSGVEIDLKKKTYQEYMLFFFMIKIGKPKSYEKIENILVQDEKVENKTILGTKVKNVFIVFLHFSNGNKVQLISEDNKASAVTKAKILGERISVPVNVR